MMKKVLYGVALALLASVSMGSLQSCKDDVNDLKTQTSYDLAKLHSQLDGEAARLKALIDANAANIAGIQADYAKLSYVNQKVSDLEAAIAAGDAALKADLEGQINGAVSTLNGRIDALETDQNAKREALKSELEGKIGANTAAIEALDTYVKGLESNMNNEFEQVYMQIQDAYQMISSVNQLLEDYKEEMAEQLEQLTDQITTAIDAITTRLDKQVTGILIQGVYSPAFGDFRTPLGIKSNMLFNWYGKNEWGKAVKFPNDKKEFNTNGDPGLDLKALSPDGTMEIAPESYYADNFGNVTLGKVYVTLNPVGAQFDHLNVTVENSAGTALPMTITLKPSDEILYHGYTRTEENGFYEGEAIMSVEEAVEGENAVVYNINEDLEASMKNILKNPSMNSAKEVVKAIFDQLAYKVPAYGLRYDWTGALVDEEETDPGFVYTPSYAVLSQYDLAVATALPLSYNFLSDYQGSAKLPEVGHIQNFINKLKEVGNITIDFGDPFKVKGVTVDLGEISFEGVDTDLSFTLKNVKISYTDGTSQTIASSDPIVIKGEDSGMDDMLNEIKNAINKTLKQAGADVTGQLDAMTKDIEDQVNNMMSKINDQISGKVNDMINGVTDKLEPYYGKINKAIDLYNKVAKKVNNFLTNPNAYLQAAAFYKMGNDYGILSGKASDPTPFVQDGGDALTVYLSSYTGELIVPACRKYIAITNVYKNGKPEIFNGSINEKLGEEFNNGMVTGNRIEFKIPADVLTVGKVYEFTYQALDYHGYTSTKKFYIEVK